MHDRLSASRRPGRHTLIYSKQLQFRVDILQRYLSAPVRSDHPIIRQPYLLLHLRVDGTINRSRRHDDELYWDSQIHNRGSSSLYPHAESSGRQKGKKGEGSNIQATRAGDGQSREKMSQGVQGPRRTRVAGVSNTRMDATKTV